MFLFSKFSIRAANIFALCLGLLAVTACSDHSRKTDNENSHQAKPGDCSSGEVDDVGIISGKTVRFGSWIEKNTVFLETETPAGSGSCTASIISKDVLLTAGHCVLKNQRNMTEEDATGTAVFSANPLCQLNIIKSRLVRYKDVIINPLYSEHVNGSYDVALIRLQHPIPTGFSPVPIATAQQFQILSNGNTPFVAAGYGRTQGYEIEDTYAPRLRATEPEVLTIENSEQGDFMLNQSRTGVCAGDSGGPLFAKFEGDPALVGVNSAVSNRDGESCHGLAVVMSLNRHRSFLKKAFAEIAPDEKNPF